MVAERRPVETSCNVFPATIAGFVSLVLDTLDVVFVFNEELNRNIFTLDRYGIGF